MDRLGLVLPFERRLVFTMVAHLEPSERQRVTAFVSRSLRAMPFHLRLPIAVMSLMLGAQTRLTGRGGTTEVALDRLEESRLNPIRQYARLVRSLALFAEHEARPGLGR